MMQRTNSKRLERIDQICLLLERKLDKAVAAELVAFARLLYGRVAAEDLLGPTVDDLAGAAISLWQFAAERRQGEAKLRAFNPMVGEQGWQSPHTVVEIANDDMPFLVDSVSAALSQLGFSVHALIHPIVAVRRDGAKRQGGPLAANEAGAMVESLMHIELDRVSDPAILVGIETRLAAVLADVRAAVTDWRTMLAKVDETLATLESAAPSLPAEEVAEGRALLAWMRDNNFTFLGYRENDFGAPGSDQMQPVEGSGLGLLRDPGRRIMRAQGADLSEDVWRFLRQPSLMLVLKANARSTVHRPVPLDYIAVKTFDADGQVRGERRFVGLFTSAAYNRLPAEIPYLRRKARRVVQNAGLSPSSHDGKALQHVVDTYPRDELFQMSEDDLLRIAGEIVALQERPRIRLFLRRDEFQRFVTCLVYVPRDRFGSALRLKFEGILTQAFGGEVIGRTTQSGDEPLARYLLTVSTPAGQSADLDEEGLEARLVQAARAWEDDLTDVLRTAHGEEKARRLARVFGLAFPASYREAFDAQTALFDIGKLEMLGEARRLAVNVYRPIGAPEHVLGLKLYHLGGAVALSDVLPILENLGFRAIEEHTYEVDAEGAGVYVMHDFLLEEPEHAAIDLPRLKPRLEGAFLAVCGGTAANDGFNRLIPRTALGWRPVALLRAMAKYLRQAGLSFSQDYMERTLVAHAGIATLLVDLFEARFDPARDIGRDAAQNILIDEVAAALDKVASLDEDRILRRFLNVVQSAWRTNWFQRTADGDYPAAIAFKLESAAITDLPAPRPHTEVFVYSPKVEAIHLRGGKVARGGIRWSDRREDFRTEILGLIKAQMVKNAVIVPVGAKGGFVPLRPPVGGDREAVMADGIACYRLFIGTLLDITDNFVRGKLVPPANVVRHDGDDPYLVVAADKGTATFSDIANAISVERGFWLGDAFASGGSAGYDHKKMGITARGAWELVKRHFREMGKDIQAETFTCAGVGDMSGDVFGNGMLLSQHTKLVAAFDHRHIFIDPEPDPATSWAERKRLFDLPRSSWLDYDTKLISAGGGVFDRKAKSIALTPQIKTLLALTEDAVTPNVLMRAILVAQVELLYFGGIGTYIKAAEQSQAAAGDRANDAIRIDGRDIRAKVVGEGANLGVTQAGRIEYALAGGRINTDAIDNSAGVDCSDHEVNIKILLQGVVHDGDMTLKQRDALLVEMTDEVGHLVLRDNYLQGAALSLAQAQGVSALDKQARFIRVLERRGRLDRAVEGLPDDEDMAARRAAGQALTRPEMAVLLAYAKMSLYDDLLASDAPDDAYFAIDLAKYFPRPLRRGFAEAIRGHQLRREIIATVTANSMVNRAGITFFSEVHEETRATMADIARAYAVAREVFGLRELWGAVDALDNQVPAALQYDMLAGTRELHKQSITWLLRNWPGRIDIAAAVEMFRPAAAELRRQRTQVLTEGGQAALAQRAQVLEQAGAPAELAARFAELPMLAFTFEISAAARRAEQPIAAVAGTYFAVGDRFGFDWLRQAAQVLVPASEWDGRAIAALLDDLGAAQRRVAGLVVTAGQSVADWAAARAMAVERADALLADLRLAGALDLARLAVAGRSLGALAQAAG